MAWRLFLPAIALIVGCTDEPPGEPVPPPQGAPCAPPSLRLPGGDCIRPGIPEDGCGAGFEHDGEYGCDPVLPADGCPPGQMAVPGEASCRPVMDCGAGTWGSLDIDTATVHVDASYTEPDADGTVARPWSTVAQAIAAAPAGALVAVAAGDYPESLLLEGKPLRLWGVCPEQVHLIGTDDVATLTLGEGADGTEIGGLSLTGPGRGLRVLGAADVLVDRVRIHDNLEQGISVSGESAPTSLTIRDMLVESNVTYGALLIGADASFERVVVRDTLPAADGTRGRGISAQRGCVDGACFPSRIQIRQSLIANSHDVGVRVSASELSVVDSVIESTQPRQADGFNGGGVAGVPSCPTGNVADCDFTVPPRVEITASVIRDNHDVGVFVSDGEGAVETTVVRDTLAGEAQQKGTGIHVQVLCPDGGEGLACDPAQRATLDLTRSLVERSHGTAVVAGGSEITVASSVLRHTLARPLDDRRGRGLMIDVLCTLELDQLVCDPNRRSNGVVTESLVDDAREMGISVGGSEASITRSVVRRIAGRKLDGVFGDGILVASQIAAGALQIDNTRVEESARAGVVSFGAPVELKDTSIHCATVPLAGEIYEGQSFELVDGGGNSCGCAGTEEACKVISAELEPPEAGAF